MSRPYLVRSRWTHTGFATPSVQIFDLLDTLPTTKTTTAPTRDTPTIARSSAALARNYSFFGPRASLANAAHANGGNGVLKRQALALKNDPDGGKYVAGLRDIRVRTRQEAQAVFKLGQLHRQVFGTGMNQQSSRSHGAFTFKIVRVHNGAPNVSRYRPRKLLGCETEFAFLVAPQDPESAQTSRLSIVDLAGSERSKNTHNQGERLKEAANINQSLMVSSTNWSP